MLYALGFIGLFTIGGLTGLRSPRFGLDVHVHDTYFIIAHFHFIMVGGAVMAYLGAIHFWWAENHRALRSRVLGKISAMIILSALTRRFCRNLSSVRQHAPALLSLRPGVPSL
jgi:cytochrome c oxidase subunit 1